VDLEQVRHRVADRVTPWNDIDVAVRVEAGRDGDVHVTVGSKHPSTYYNRWVDLEGQLSHPSRVFMQLLAAWRSLPVDVAAPVSSRTPRQRQRTEDRLGLDGVARLVADYQAGRSTKWLQQAHGISQGAVLRLLEVNGVPRRKRGLTDEQVQEAMRLYDQGWSLTRIGDHFGKDHTVVRNALLRAGITRRREL
jgi:hypothetical protein